MDRRFVCLGIFATVIATPAAARGMYCTRHPDACRRRREQEAADAEVEAKRRASLTPDQREAEDVQRAIERRQEQERWDRAEKERKEREEAADRSFVTSVICFGSAAGLGGLLLLLGLTRGGAK